ncbi:class I SAM-dependent DNA methyltransferase [Actinomyces sp. ZJ308]|uniref:class I SAM-dependent DNA methyltransferase n=1 Tax=Actinomyces sp. ZJ308 TaxID=2708342 RepID=UPI0014212023|nr:class I SAM-dependent DNA methyltransferase [Actinomyces sp. ZJ308]
MAVSDALVVGEDWISEHYFTTDATKESFLARVLERRKEWEALEKPAAPGSEPTPTPRSRFRSERSRLAELLAALPSEDSESLTGSALEAAGELDALLREILGFASAEFRMVERGPVTLVRPVGDEGPAPLALLRARPVTTVEDLLVKDAPTLTEAWEPVDLADPAAPVLEGAEPVESVSRALSTLMTDEHGPAFALVLAGQWALVAERERWPEGRWLAVSVQLVVERDDSRRGGEVERALTCLDARSLVPTAEGETWWAATLEDSAAHTVGVSKDLREGVRSSIEIIANEVVRRRAARGLEPLPQERAQDLALQSLRYIYRVIFLLYAEASPELGVLPVGAAEYDAGYGLDRLRDLALTELHEESSQAGTHIYESLDRLFRLVDEGHNAEVSTQEEGGFDGLVFRPMRADLFRREATGLIDEVGLGNGALLRVLRHLLLTRENGQSGRGFISYVELGINQLGAVYEGLMSYSGSFATERLWEVAPGGDASKGSWVVPEDVMKGLEEKDFVTVEDEVTGERRNVTYEEGQFVYRLSGRDRQRSASFYTPEVLTRFTVQQALAELLDQDGRVTSAEEILHLTVCEPALGSGAFAIEAVRQLAEQYLSRRERELGRRVDPEERPRELAKVKAYLALHQVYGVDLNATAVELAEVSLWLDTMVEGLAAPWFGLRLRRGNSLVGARRALYSTSQLRKRAWLAVAPVAEPLSQVAAVLDDDARASRHRLGGALDVSGSIHHFLLPAKGWGSAVEVPKQVRDLVDAERLKALKTWRTEIRKAPSAAQTKRLTALARRVEVLWELTLRRLRVAEAEASRSIDLWGREARADAGSTVSREEIEAYLAAPNSAYRRLRLVMDAWCALWFWPLTTQVTPPSLDEWLGALEALLGKQVKDAKGTDGTLVEGSSWAELDFMEEVELGLAGARQVEAVATEHEWLEVVRGVAEAQGFFHWELDFATVFARGGFDLQVGNPPWVRPDVAVETLLADGDPWWVLAKKPSVAARNERMPRTLARPDVLSIVLDGAAESEVLSEFISGQTVYPLMEGRPDLYRAFMCQVWEHQSERGIASLIHMETHFTDAKTPGLRAAAYRHLRRHWQFINELQLFDIQNQKIYGIHVYGTEREPSFLHATSLYHPETALRSLAHDGSGEEPGFKDPHTGTWDLRPHAARIETIDEPALKTWQSVTEADYWRCTPMVSTVNSAAARTLATLANQPRTGSLDLQFSTGWNETTDFQKGIFSKEWGSTSWDNAILQGPHLYVSTPLYKQPNETMRNFLDWTSTDLETLPANAQPTTQYKPAGDRDTYDRLYTHWDNSPARDHYRIAWRRMAPLTGERTLAAAIIPPGPTHIDGLFSTASYTPKDTLLVSATLSTLLSDLLIRAGANTNIRERAISRLPLPSPTSPLARRITLRSLRLNCVTDAYAGLWAECWDESFKTDSPILERHDERPIGPEWTEDTPLRRAEDRRNAQAEIDVMVAMMLGVPIEDLCTIYRTQFAVLYDYDQGRGQGAYVYDANGRQLPTPVRQAWEKRQRPTSNEDMPLSERTHTHPGSGVSYVYDLPFRIRDRESDFRRIHTALTNR